MTKKNCLLKHLVEHPSFRVCVIETVGSEINRGERSLWTQCSRWISLGFSLVSRRQMALKKNSPNEAVFIFSFIITLQAFLNELQLNHLGFKSKRSLDRNDQNWVDEACFLSAFVLVLLSLGFYHTPSPHLYHLWQHQGNRQSYWARTSVLGRTTTLGKHLLDIDNCGVFLCLTHIYSLGCFFVCLFLLSTCAL